ncbi:MAG: cupin domain-containing protein [Methyloceanibacter sp.]|uniref:cupin domain-containing protein n=1 Tax=Methyloceanibacter sp. TaxID=1965321 RepID=UPI003D6CEFDF
MTADPPKLAYWHVWTDDEGVTHQARCELSDFVMRSMGGKAAPQWNDHLLTGETSVLFCVLPAGWIGDWHENPKPQWIVVVSGRWFVETMDGMRVEMGPGEVSFGGDQGAKTDAQGRVGHRSGTVGDEACALMVVQLDDAWSGARPGAFK